MIFDPEQHPAGIGAEVPAVGTSSTPASGREASRPPVSGLLSVTSEVYADDTVVIHAAGDLDYATVGLLEHEIAAAEPFDRLVFDFGDLCFLCVAGLRALAALRHRSGAVIAVASERRAVQRALGLLDEPRVPVYETLSDAVRALAGETVRQATPAR